MTSRIVDVVLDALDPERMAAFWAEALGWTAYESGGEIGLTPTDGTPFDILFEPTDEPKRGQNRHHLDLTTSSWEDQAATVERLLALGGRHVDIGQTAEEEHVVLADPEGNELCIIEPTNTFLAGTGRLGAINCDGSRSTGVFWSEVLGWPLVWDQDGETAVRSPDGTGPLVTWSGPPLIPKHAKNRLHLDVAPVDTDQASEVERLLSLGATTVDVGQGDVDWVVLADPDGNELCVLSPR